MSIDLTDQQWQAVEAGEVVEVYNDGIILYVISKERYERMQQLMDLGEIDASLFEADDIHLTDD